MPPSTPVDPFLPCPACGFTVLSEGYGCHEICPVCGWEDDGVQLANPTSGGGGNRESLAAAQERALHRFPPSLRAYRDWKRASSWRPLTVAEIREAERKRSAEHWHTRAVTSPCEVYFATGERDDVEGTRAEQGEDPTGPTRPVA